MRNDTHAFKGFEVVENESGRLSVMVPFRNTRGDKQYRPEGDFQNRTELADYCHGKVMAWSRV